MKLLLDECIDRRFARSLLGHDVKTVPQMGWAGVKNGELIRIADGKFDAFITVDRVLPVHSKFSIRQMAVLVLRAKTNRLIDLEPLAPKVLDVLIDLKPGVVRYIEIEGGLPPHIGIVADAPRLYKASRRQPSIA